MWPRKRFLTPLPVFCSGRSPNRINRYSPSSASFTGGDGRATRCTPSIVMNRRREKRRIANGGLPPGAIAADTSQQVQIYTYGSPKTFYVDVAFRCQDCGVDEVWTAKQQKWFYEVAKGPLHATAVRCRDCRNKRKDQKELQRQQMQDAANAKRDG